MRTLPISVCTLALNEEKNIARCLQSVPFAAERILVDSGSTDRTVEIAKGLGARVVTHPFEGYVAQSAYSISLAAQPWVLQLDADEALGETLQSEILARFGDLEPPEDGFRMPRCTFFFDRWIRHSGWYPDYKTRLFRKDRGRISGEEPHQHGEVDGRLGTLSNSILHHTYSGLDDHARTIERLARMSAESRRKAGRKPSLLRAALAPAFKALRAYVWKRGFLDGRAGLLLALYAAHYAFLKEAYLFESPPPAKG
ncbi:MAG: glycosyltransferase family 2 protein [Planctomycetota bacterium]